jgi:hypothetical protein
MLAAKQAPTPPSRQEQIIRGVYGILAYAVDYWLDYLTTELSNPCQSDTSTRSDFLDLLSLLASALGYSRTSETAATLSPQISLLFAEGFSHNSGLFSMTSAVMECRQKPSLDQAESEGCSLFQSTTFDGRKRLMADSNVTIENHEIREPRYLDQLKATY